MTAEDIRVFVEPAIARFNDRDDRLGFLEPMPPTCACTATRPAWTATTA